jgi:hypothetical protein
MKVRIQGLDQSELHDTGRLNSRVPAALEAPQNVRS